MRIADLPPVPYRPGDLAATTFIRGGEGWSFHQGPNLYEYPDGRLFLAWAVYDVQECSNDGGSLYSTSLDGGETWRRPELWLKVPNAVTWHTGLLQLRDTRTVLMAGSEGHFAGAVEDARHRRVTRWA
ncbi:MAG: sialidase family protein, partial [Gemmatimonadota bacterium]